MKRQSKILISITFLSLVLVLYIIFSARIVRIPSDVLYLNDNFSSSSKEVDLVEVKENYNKEAKIIFEKIKFITNTLISASENNENNDFEFKFDDIQEIKSQFIALTLPGEQKDFHLNVILTISNIEKFFSDNNKNLLVEAKDLLNQADLIAPWL